MASTATGVPLAFAAGGFAPARRARCASTFPRSGSLRTAWLDGGRIASAPAAAARPRHCPRMLLGGGGILGVGPQELMVVAAVGWFLLGPKQLLALSKDVGKLVGEVRKAADDARSTFSDALEADLAADAAEEARRKAEGPVVAGPAPFDGGETPFAAGDADAPVGPVSAPTASAAPDVAASTAEFTAPSQPEPAPIAEDDPSRSNFLDQLQRAADPTQTAPVDDVPDLDVDAEVEVARLERQLLAARERLKRKQAVPPPVAEGGDEGAES